MENITLGSTVMLRDPSYSTHRWFTWDKGMVTDFSSDQDEVTIVSVVKGKEKHFTEFVDNLKLVKYE